MSRRITQQVPAADGIVVTLAYFLDSLLAKVPPEVGTPVRLWVEETDPIPVVCYLSDDTPIGVLPLHLGALLAQDFLWRGQSLECWVETSGYTDDGDVWVQVRIVGVIANDPSIVPTRGIRAALGGGDHE